MDSVVHLGFHCRCAAAASDRVKQMNWAALQTAAALAAAPALIAWLTARLALARFRSEKLWEKQLEMYRDIVDALYDSREFSSFHWDYIISSQEPSEDDKNKIREEANLAHIKIRKVSEIGKLLISKQAIRILDRYLAEHEKIQNSRDWTEYIDEHLAMTSRILRDFITVARRDLRL